MKKTIFYCLLLLSVIFVSCQDNEIVAPENEAQVSLNHEEDRKGLAASSASKARVKPSNGVAYTTASYVPEELYIAKNNALYAVDASTGSSYALNPDMPYMPVMASIGGYIYGVLNDNLYKIDPTTGVFTNIDYGWTGVEALTAGRVGLVNYVFGVQGGQIWRFNLSNNTSASISDNGWGGTQGMTFGGGYLFIVHGDVLYKMNASTGAYSVLEPSGWDGVKAMTFYNGYMYAVWGNQLWRTNPNGSGSVAVGYTSSFTNEMTTYGDNLYAVEGLGGDFVVSLRKINPSNALSTNLTGSTDWDWTWSMAGRQ
ncbi:hypothetical protein KK083_24940 [Fulvivirgaceae bacterium PWU4]|uniref:Uncharacterized protein n=1 Tax=Chryseosolibacter histidini TaxID=2782349 RepID=A0AAP2DRG6_9BACT|nr:hypothetical protein [Chryseosolibacter histidini]MBT1700159.1 hypothetical protein [Chryseosolibacter histidini]